MFDWNGNGREDWGDRYIDYQIYNDIHNNDDETSSNGNQHHSDSGGEGFGCFSSLFVFFAVFLIWNILTN